MELNAMTAAMNARVQSEASVLVARKAQGAAKDQGEAAVAMMQAAMEQSKAMAAGGVKPGGGVDVYA